MGFSRQQYWSGLPCHAMDLPNPGIKPMSFTSPASAAWFSTTSTTCDLIPRCCAYWELGPFSCLETKLNSDEEAVISLRSWDIMGVGVRLYSPALWLNQTPDFSLVSYRHNRNQRGPGLQTKRAAFHVTWWLGNTHACSHLSDEAVRNFYQGPVSQVSFQHDESKLSTSN